MQRHHERLENVSCLIISNSSRTLPSSISLSYEKNVHGTWLASTHFTMNSSDSPWMTSGRGQTSRAKYEAFRSMKCQLMSSLSRELIARSQKSKHTFSTRKSSTTYAHAYTDKPNSANVPHHPERLHCGHSGWFSFDISLLIVYH